MEIKLFKGCVWFNWLISVYRTSRWILTCKKEGGAGGVHSWVNSIDCVINEHNYVTNDVTLLFPKQSTEANCWWKPYREKMQPQQQLQGTCLSISPTVPLINRNQTATFRKSSLPSQRILHIDSERSH